MEPLITLIRMDVRVAKKSSQLKKASKYMENGVKLRKLLGKPSKTRSYSSCMNGVSKDMKLTYANIYVSLGKKISGGEIIYGIQAPIEYADCKNDIWSRIFRLTDSK